MIARWQHHSRRRVEHSDRFQIILRTVAAVSACDRVMMCVQPQHSLPDVLVWMICEKRRIAYCKFPAGDLIYAPNDMIGKYCGTRQTIMLKVQYCFFCTIT